MYLARIIKCVKHNYKTISINPQPKTMNLKKIQSFFTSLPAKSPYSDLGVDVIYLDTVLRDYILSEILLIVV